MQTPKISVIVPIYNASSTLNRCINSILGQSYENFELILINDGSSDNSRDVCEQYASVDQSVLIFHQLNMGVSAARNKGISESRGDYLVFCDSDDYLDENCLEKLIEYKAFDIVLCSYETIPDHGVRLFQNGEFLTKDAIASCLEAHIYTGFSMPWAKLYHREIVVSNSLFFDERLSSGEDTLWVNKYLLHVNSIRMLSYNGYRYNKEDREGLSATSIDEATMEVTINKIVESYNDLETKFQANLTEWKINVGMYFFHRFITGIARLNLFQIFSMLKSNCEKNTLKPIFLDRDLVLKGMRLKFFNFLVRQRLYMLLALNVKLQKRYL
ncbi:glycosyltransferase family 2 protein [Albibacterium indicum]|uniref:glycosyltransferase family 2 protein n=1 Tax=Albibacterium indicum TaxID=2292082 RepID=UPI0013007002|nr:glycosyltransferase family 2 protein [Pedobacter indicus]